MSAIEKYQPLFDKSVARQRYEELCRIRDQVNKDTEGLRAAKDEAVDEAEAARVKAAAAARRFHDARGGAKWTQLKNEIGLFARLMGDKPQSQRDIQAATKALKGS